MTIEQQLTDTNSQLAQLVQVSQQQASNIEGLRASIEQIIESSRQQRQTIERPAGAFIEQARAITTLQRAAQASEAAAVVAQSNQNAIRDLIEELRQGR